MTAPIVITATPNTPTTADACDREATWLRTTGDTLPSLLVPAGPWEVIQAYWPGPRFASQRPGIYVLRTTLDDYRAMNGRIRPQYGFRLRLWWPVRAAAYPLAETEQRDFDQAINLLVLRVRGKPQDKTHNWFLSAGEDPRMPPPQVVWDDPEASILTHKCLTASMTYHADDYEVDG